MDEPTPEQQEYLRILQKKLGMPDWLLDMYCDETFGKPFEKVDRRTASRLIETFKNWDRLPADLQRLKGQLDLF